MFLKTSQDFKDFMNSQDKDLNNKIFLSLLFGFIRTGEQTITD